MVKETEYVVQTSTGGKWYEEEVFGVFGLEAAIDEVERLRSTGWTARLVKREVIETVLQEREEHSKGLGT